MSDPKPEPWYPPAPSDHPEAADRPWPPNIPTAGELAPPKGRKGNEPYCGNLVQNAFGDDYFRKLEASQPQFKGNWWLLATLLRFEEAVRGDGRPDRFAWWNGCIVRLIEHKVPLDLTGAKLESRNLCHVSLREVILADSELSQDVLLHDADLSNSTWRSAKLSDVHGHRATLNESDFRQAVLKDCNFTQALFIRADIRARKFHSCTLRQCDLTDAKLDPTELYNTTLRGSRLHRAQVSELKLSEADLSNVKGLFGPNRVFTRVCGIKEHHTEAARFHRPWKIRKGIIGLADRAVDNLERHAANWEFLRAIGQFRLFGVSYLAVIAITSYTLLARWHNTRVVSSAHTAAERARQTGEDDMWATLLGSLPHLPTPAHLGYQLAATALLAIAATVYALRCPNEVREATEVGWTRRMGQPLWEYRSAKWSRALARYLCLAFFVVGGSYTLYYLVARSLSAVMYLLGGLSSG